MANNTTKGLWALSPLAVFLCLYLVTSLVAGDFYKVPIAVAFLAASVYAVLITRGMKLSERVERFSAGAAHKNIMLMIWIFVLAGAFAASAKEMGAIDATVNLTLRILAGQPFAAGNLYCRLFYFAGYRDVGGDDRGTGSGGGGDCAADWVGCRVDGGCCGGGRLFRR